MNVAASRQVVTKGRFAELRNVSPGRVSQWISEGKIKAPALVGEGRNAQIDVEFAVLQLRQTLDIGQRTGNGIDTRLDLPEPPAAATLPLQDLSSETPPAVNAPPAPPAASLPSDPIADAIKQERLDQIRRTNRRAAEEEAQRAGLYTETAEVTRQFVKLASEMMSVMEGALPELATAVSAKFAVPQRDVLHLLRAEFRNVRTAAAKSFRDRGAGMPVTIEAEMPETSDT